MAMMPKGYLQSAPAYYQPFPNYPRHPVSQRQPYSVGSSVAPNPALPQKTNKKKETVLSILLFWVVGGGLWAGWDYLMDRRKRTETSEKAFADAMRSPSTAIEKLRS